MITTNTHCLIKASIVVLQPKKLHNDYHYDCKLQSLTSQRKKDKSKKCAFLEWDQIDVTFSSI